MSDVNVQAVIDTLSEQIRVLTVENAILKAQVAHYVSNAQVNSEVNTET